MFPDFQIYVTQFQIFLLVFFQISSFFKLLATIVSKPVSVVAKSLKKLEIWKNSKKNLELCYQKLEIWKKHMLFMCFHFRSTFLACSKYLR